MPDERYIIVGSNRPAIFIGIMNRLRVAPDEGMRNGLTEDILKKIDKEAVKQGVSIVVIQKGIENYGEGKQFTFAPMFGDRNATVGVMKPKLLDLDEGKPERDAPIDDIDAGTLHNVLEDAKTVEDFLREI